jgi:hypothetical protein
MPVYVMGGTEVQIAKRQCAQPSEPGRDRGALKDATPPGQARRTAERRAEYTNAPVITTADPAEYEAQRFTDVGRWRYLIAGRFQAASAATGTIEVTTRSGKCSTGRLGWVARR